MAESEHWICGRCLAVLNVSTAIYAESTHEPGAVEPFPGVPTNVAQLRAWAEDRVASGEWVIVIDTYRRAFAPVATWHGDPVCEVHLRMLVGHELTGRWY